MPFVVFNLLVALHSFCSLHDAQISGCLAATTEWITNCSLALEVLLDQLAGIG
jgi:hypothetical protein